MQHLEQIKRCISQNDDSNSLLLLGKDKDLRQSEIESFISWIFMTYAANDVHSKLEFNPDYLAINDSSGDSIKIDAIRQIMSFVAIKSTNSYKKIVYIDDAAKLTVEASNALLKVTEEPHSNCIIILGAASADNLLDTVQSRCLHFNILNSDNCIRKIYSADPEFNPQENFNSMLSDLSLCFVERQKHKLDLAKDWSKLEKPEIAANLFIIIAILLRSKFLLEKPKNKVFLDLAGICTKSKLWSILNKVEEFNRNMADNKNLNLQLAIEDILFSWG